MLIPPPWPKTLAHWSKPSPGFWRRFTRWHKTFEDMEAAVSEVLDHLEDYRGGFYHPHDGEVCQRHPHARAVAGQSVAA